MPTESLILKSALVSSCARQVVLFTANEPHYSSLLTKVTHRLDEPPPKLHMFWGFSKGQGRALKF